MPIGERLARELEQVHLGEIPKCSYRTRGDCNAAWKR